MGKSSGSFADYLLKLESKLASILSTEPMDQAAYDETLRELTEEAPAELLAVLKRHSPKMLKEHRSLAAGFERRNFSRWRAAFDLLEMAVVIADETGEEFAQTEAPKADADLDYRTAALSHIFPRAILVCREIICLLKGGFPDGALTRWRTLHELAVTAVFLQGAEPEISKRYLASFHFQALHAAKQYNLHAERARLTPFTDTELADLAAICDAHSEILGGALKGDFDWARPALSSPPTFAALETAVGLDHWRPRYRWASQHAHGGHRPPGALLGLAESEMEVNLVGQSNSGFVDPLHMTALSLSQVSAAFLLQNPDFSRIAICSVLKMLAEQVGETALRIERETLEQHKARVAEGGPAQ